MSANQQYHEFKLIFYDQRLFQSVTKKYVWPMLELKSRLPVQIEPSVGNNLNNTAQVAAATTKMILSGSFIVNFFLKTSLSQILGLI